MLKMASKETGSPSRGMVMQEGKNAEGTWRSFRACHVLRAAKQGKLLSLSLSPYIHISTQTYTDTDVIHILLQSTTERRPLY